MNTNTNAIGLPVERLGPYPPAGLLETITCKDKRDGRVLVVNTKDLGSRLFPTNRFVELTGAELDAIEFEQTVPESKPIRHSLYTAKDLDLPTMRIRELKMLPEYALIPDDQKKKFRIKEQFVKAILQVRCDQPETPKSRVTF